MDKESSKNNVKKVERERDVLQKMNLVLESCDPDTMCHCIRVGAYAKKIMEFYQAKYRLDVEYTLDILQWAATLHDIGKSRVPLKILMKPTKLTSEEFAIIKKHAPLGEQILQEEFNSKNQFLINCAHDVILYHHERYDGKGYPNNLKEEIPICAQMVGLADCYDALISARSYKPSYTSEKAYNMIMNEECGAFSPEILSCLEALIK